MQMFIGWSVIITSIGASGAVTASWPDEPRWMLRIDAVVDQRLATSGPSARRGSSGNRARRGFSVNVIEWQPLAGDAADLVGAQLGVPQHGQRHRDDAPRVACPHHSSMCQSLYARTTASARSLSVDAGEEPTGERRERREAHAREHTARAHVLHALVDVVTAGPHLLERRGVDAVLLRRAPGDGVEPDVRDRGAVEHPHVVAAVGVHDLRRLVGVLRGHPPVEHVRRLDHVVVDADEDHVVDVHGVPPSDVRFRAAFRTSRCIRSGSPRRSNGGEQSERDRSGAAADDPGRRAAGRRAVRRRRRHSSTATCADRSPSSPTTSTTPARALIASGRRARRPRRDLGAEHLGVGGRRARLPLGRRGRDPAQHPVQGQRGRLRARRRAAPPGCSPSPTSSTPTTSSCSRGAPGAESDRARSSCCAARCPTGCVSWNDFLARGDEVDRSRADARAADAVQPDDLCDILFTSGTTGPPKGAMLVHAASIRAYDAWSDVVGLRDGDRYLIVNPFFHAFGLKAGILACAAEGRDDHPAPGVRRARGDAPRRRGAHHHAARARRRSSRRSSTTPTSTSFDLSTLRLSVTGAAAIPVELIIDMREKLGFETVVTGYGLTETHGIATMCRHDDDPETIAKHRRAAPSPASRCVVVDDDGARSPAGEPGEVVVRGYNVMKGYFDDPEATAEAIDADGWLHTGDIAYQDDGGNLAHHRPHEGHVHRRRLQRVPGRDREHHAAATPTSRRSRWSASPTPRLGEVGMAFVVPTHRHRPSTPTSSSPGAARTWPTTRCRATSSSSTSCRSTPSARC